MFDRLRGRDLIFISIILRDGSGTEPLKRGDITRLKDDWFHINCLSLSAGTYIASNFNCYVVKIRKFERRN